MKNVRVDVRKRLLLGLNEVREIDPTKDIFSYVTSKSIHIVLVSELNGYIYFTTRKHDGIIVAETYLPIERNDTSK